MITIHKYHFDLAHAFEIEMPKTAKILDVQKQNERWTMWAMVDTIQTKVVRKFKAYFTGEKLYGLDLFRNHIATIQDEELVWHIFE